MNGTPLSLIGAIREAASRHLPACVAHEIHNQSSPDVPPGTVRITIETHGQVTTKQEEKPMAISVVGTSGATYARAPARIKRDPYREHALTQNICECTIGELTGAELGQSAARERNEAALAVRVPRLTKSERELAKAHPWVCGGEDEP